MLRAHANTPVSEFIAQLRTYVIAMGLSTQVVDIVDELADMDEIEHTDAGQMRDNILTAVKKYFDGNPSPLSEKLKTALINVIEAV